MMKINCLRAALTLAALAVPPPVLAQTTTPEQNQLREIYQELVEINTTDSVGDTTQAARAMAARLKAGGYTDADMQIIVPPGGPKKGNLVARLKGNGAKKPLLLLAHLDVVEAKREDWERDPFKLIEENGYFYARGASDDKAMAAAFVANMIRMKQEGFVPNRRLQCGNRLRADGSRGDGGENTHAHVAGLGIVEVKPNASVVGPFFRDLNRVAKLGLEQRVRIGVDPDREGTSPAPFLESEIALHREKDSAIARQHISRFKTAAAGVALFLCDAEDLRV